MKKRYPILIVLCTLTMAAGAQQQGLGSIDRNDLVSHMTFLASDELQGRETGAQGNDVAALYIKTQLMQMGLQPIPETGDYFQNIPMTSSYLDPEGTGMTLKDNTGDEIFSTDSIFFLLPPPGSLDLSGNAVFAGYGYRDPNSDYNDFEGVDLRDKIVLIMTGQPGGQNPGQSVIANFEGTENQKIMSIFTRSPRALLFVFNPANEVGDIYESGMADLIPGGRPGSRNIHMKGQSQMALPFPILFITRHAADAMLKSTGSTLRQLEDRIIAEGKPASAEMDGLTVTIQARIETSDRDCPNVIGIIEGSDPLLKEECVLYSAHFDHTGVSGDGEVLNGADDNASGSAGLLEIAEAFMSLRKKPLRSIVFAWVNGEEKGLYGSRYLADHPVIPMEKTALNINFDMIGRSRLPSDSTSLYGFELDITQPGQIMAYTARENGELIQIMDHSAGIAGIEVLQMGPDIPMGSSDHASFLAKGVTAICFNTGIHSDLHGPGDDVEKIDFDKMEKVSKMGFLLGYEVANRKERIGSDPQE